MEKPPRRKVREFWSVGYQGDNAAEQADEFIPAPGYREHDGLVVRERSVRAFVRRFL